MEFFFFLRFACVGQNADKYLGHVFTVYLYSIYITKLI